MLKVREIVYGDTDPFAEFPLADFPGDLQGWGSEHPMLQAAIWRTVPDRIIEVGSWKGMSAINMAKICQSLGLTTEIVCVDTWLGSPGLYTRKGDPYKASLAFKFGYPQLYMTFAANIINAGVADRISPFPAPSLMAAEVLASFSVSAPIIYIDASHDYKSVMDDLVAYWPLLRPDGVLIGDDYNWAGVKRAADEFATRVGFPLVAEGEKFSIHRRSATAVGAAA